LSFHQHSTSSRFSEDSSTSSTIDLERNSKIPSIINIPYHANPPRKSTSDILSTNFQNADYTTRNTIQDVVSTLILTISLHFVGDPSHLKDKNVELLSNLRCKKLSDFQW
jgi:hypothetical protein